MVLLGSQIFHSLNSLRGLIYEIIHGSIIGVIRGILGAKTIAQMVPEFLYPLPDWGHDVLSLADGVACYLFVSEIRV